MRAILAGMMAVALVFGAPGITGPREAKAQSAARDRVIKTCTTDSGLWGFTNNRRSKIDVFADNTARYATKVVGEPEDTPWHVTRRFPAAAGDSIRLADASILTVQPDGAGYATRLSTPRGRVLPGQFTNCLTP